MEIDVNTMKKTLTILGAIFICLIVVGAIVFSGLYYFASRLDKEARAYLDEIVPIIVTYWDPKELINRASPEFLQVYPAEKVESLFDSFSDLMGPFMEYKGAKGKIKIATTTKGKPIIVADYQVRVVFEKAPAKIQIEMIRQDGKWQIAGFRVVLESFAPYKERTLKRSDQTKYERAKILGLTGHLMRMITKTRLSEGD